LISRVWKEGFSIMGRNHHIFRPATFVLLIALAASPLFAQQPYQPKYNGDAAHSDQEFLALAYMHTFLNAQRLYQKKHTKYAGSLRELVGSGSFTRRMATTDRGDYAVSFHPGTTKFTLQMTPKVFDAQHRAFWVNQDGIIHVDPIQPATAESPVLRPE
jgi:hypothetical protein